MEETNGEHENITNGEHENITNTNTKHNTTNAETDTTNTTDTTQPFVIVPKDAILTSDNTNNTTTATAAIKFGTCNAIGFISFGNRHQLQF